MALNNQMPLSALGVKGSLSDILPDLQDLVDVKDARSLRKSLGAAERAAMDSFRELIQRGHQVASSETTPEASQAAPAAASQASGSMWGPFPPLDLRSHSAAPQLQPASERAGWPAPAAAAAASARRSSMPATVAELMPYASFFQAQGLLGATGTAQELWQRFMQSRGVTQQAMHQLAQQSTLQPPPMHPATALRGLPVFTGSSEPASAPPLQPALSAQGIKRTAAGQPKAMQSSRVADRAEDSAPSSSAISEQQQSLDRRRNSDASTPLPRGSKLLRTPRQQEQNKQAQQRYRERRKMKVSDMEGKLTTMQQHVSELQSVMKQNVALQDKALALETQLAEKDRLCSELAAERSAAAPPDVSLAPPSAEDLSELKMELQSRLTHLETLVDCHGIRRAVAGEGSGEAELAQEACDKLGEAVRRCLETARRAQAEGIHLGDLLTQRGPGKQAGQSLLAPPWPDVIRGMHLSKTQSNELVARHQGHIQLLETLAAQQRAHLQAIQCHREDEPDATAAAGQNCGCCNTKARQDLDLARGVHQLLEGLRKESRVTQQFDAVVTARILRPAQAALLVVDGWPAAADSLAFTSALVAGQSAAAAAAAAGSAQAACSEQTGTD